MTDHITQYTGKQAAVIILNWNGINLLREFLPLAEKYTVSSRADLIVADNGSTDGSAEWIKLNCPGVKVLRFPETPGWLDPLLDYMESHPECGALQPKIRSYRQKEMFEYAGAAGGLLDRNGYPYCRGRLFSSIEADTGQYDGQAAPVAWASGAAMLVRTALYLEAGGLDPDFFAHMEEIDLCCRIHAAGYGIVCVPDSVVYHVGGASLAQGNPKKTYLNFRNNLLLLHKNLPRRTGRRKLFIRRLYDTLAWGMFMLRFDFRNAAAILRAHRDFRRMRRNYTSFPDTDILASLPGARRNIIIDHYIKRQKK